MLIIPSTLDGYTVTAIGERAFAYTDSLTNITIPDSVTSIGGYSFTGCDGLTSVTIGSGVASIAAGAFYNCKLLTSVNGGSNVTEVGAEAFLNTLWLENQTGAVMIGTLLYAYRGTDTSYTVPDTVTSIASSAFLRCTSLTSVEIPKSVASIGDYAFGYCTSLTSLKLSEGVTGIGEEAFRSCTGLTEVTIPSSVTTLERGAFFGCSKLTRVTVLGKDTEIGAYALGYHFGGSTLSAASEESLSPATEPFESSSKLEGFTIIGYSASTARDYATINGFTFEPLDALDLSDATVKVAKATYTGKALTPAVTVTLNGETVSSGNYTVSYSDNTNVGTGKVTVTGVGSCTGKVTAKFNIAKASNSITPASVTKTYSAKAQTFSIKAKGGAKLSCKSSSKSVTVNSKGKVTIAKKFVGKATITVTAAATANYKKATKKITVTVNPSKVTLSSVKNAKSKKMTVKWKKNTTGSGYEIQYATDKNFTKNAKTVKVTANKTTSKTISGLTKKKTYYVRVRAYKGSCKGAWSGVKSVKITK